MTEKMLTRTHTLADGLEVISTRPDIAGEPWLSLTVLTGAQWDEYCEVLRKECAKECAKELQARKERNRAAWLAAKGLK